MTPMKMLLRSTLRDIKSNLGRFLSIFAIVAIGVGFFAGVKAAQPDMAESADRYYQNQKLMDVRIIPVNGFSKNEVDLIKEQLDCTAVPSYYTDSLVKSGESEFVARFYSYSGKVNIPLLTDGRLPEKAGECIVDSDSYRATVKVGDKVKIETESAPLSAKEYKVVGTFSSPLYVSDSQFGTTLIGNGQIATAVYVRESEFTLKRYNQMYLYFDFMRENGCYSDDYYAAVDDVKKRLEVLAERQEGYIVSAAFDLRDAGLDMLSPELAERIDEVYQLRDSISAAEEELADSKEKLDRLYSQIETYRLAAKVAGMEADFGEAEVDRNYESGLKSLYETETRLNELKLKLAELKSAHEAAVRAYEERKAALDAMTPDTDGYNAAKAEVDSLSAAATSAGEEYSELDSRIASATEAYERLKESYQASDEQLKSDRDALLKTEITTKEQYAQAVEIYSKAKAEYDIAREAYITQGNAINDMIYAMRTNVGEVLKQFDTIWLTFDRRDLPAYTEYSENADRIGNIGKVFPVFFLLVAALVCLTGMTRMIDEQRTQIGVLKAMGCSNGAILSQFMLYSLSATALGCAVGCIVGFRLFPSVILHAYTILYNIPVVLTPFRWSLALVSSAITLACIALTVLASCMKELTGRPAQLIRPKAPPMGKRILLERVGFIWKHMSFVKKVTARNIFRYKRRMLMTVIGIAGCTALVLTGFGLRDSITDIVNLQFGRIQQYDALVAFSNREAAEQQATESLGKSGSSLTAYNRSVILRGEDSSLDAGLIAAEDDSRLTEFIALNERVSGKAHKVDSTGAVLTEKAAKLLKVSVGDSITVVSDGKALGKLKITAIVENYVHNYVYVSNATAERLCGDDMQYNVLLCKLGGADSDRFSKAMLSVDGVEAVSLSESTRTTFSDIIGILDLVTLVLIVSAAALAFVVLFSLANINIAERRREIATLKVLGFTPREVSAYVFRENIVLTVLGALVGLGLGYALAMFVIVSAEIDIAMFGRTIYWYSFALSFVITIIFSLAVNLIMNRKLDKIDMVESLKSVE